MSRERRSPCETQTRLPEIIETIRTRAEQGHVLDQVRWGDVLLNSVHVLPDPERARRWYAIAASAGFAPAHNMLGRCHQFGWGCPLDLAAARLAYAEAERLGDVWGGYNLGIMTMRGLGGPADLVAAFAHFRAAAEAGHAKSMNLVARFTEEGWTVPRDPAAARAWYRRSAEHGDYRGQHNYATLLLSEGMVAEALDWWRRAATNATSDIRRAMRRSLIALDTAEARDILALLPAEAVTERFADDPA